MLPDELLLKIIKFAMADLKGKLTVPMRLDVKHDFAVFTIARISTRFKRVAADQSLWKGRLCINAWNENLIELIQSIRHFPIRKLRIGGVQMIYGYQIQVLAKMCPKVEDLHLPRITYWPTLLPWLSLRSLTITVDVIVWTANMHSDVWHDDVGLHRSLPNLKFLKICGYSSLPYMAECKELDSVELDGKFWLWASSHYAKIPFPRNLKRLCGPATIAAGSRDLLQRYFEDCDIQADVKFHW